MKPMTPYVCYFKKKRAEYPKLNFSDLTKKVAASWRGLDEAGKKTYTDQSEADKLRYKQEMKKYKPPSESSNDLSEESSEQKPTNKKRKRERDPDQPKAALNAYLFYMKENRQTIKKENPGLKTTDISRKIGELWRALTDAEKKPYVDLALEDKKRYQEQMTVYTEKKRKEENDAS